MFTVSEAWETAHPGATAGVLVMRHVANPATHPAVDALIAECETALRAQYHGRDRAAVKALPPIQAYAAYYRRYKKTYHVQLQVESVALKGKALPRGPALIAAMVATELRHLLLTAGHDLAAIEPPVTLTVATGGERYRLLNGAEQAVHAGDMVMTDAQGVISSVLYGPDQRTRIGPGTRHILYAVYAPPGIGPSAVARHLEDLRVAVLLFSPDAEVERLDVHGRT